MQYREFRILEGLNSPKKGFSCPFYFQDQGQVGVTQVKEEGRKSERDRNLKSCGADQISVWPDFDGIIIRGNRTNSRAKEQG